MPAASKPPFQTQNVTQFRYRSIQKGRTLIHPALRQPSRHEEAAIFAQMKHNCGSTVLQGEDTTTTCAETYCSSSEIESSRHHYTFVVCADTQIGMSSQNKEWETELQYSREAILKINAMEPKPLFVSICGDLVDMEWTFYKNSIASFSKEDCDRIQDQQNQDFKETWALLHDSIPLICLCGNHDVGNRPTKTSIQKFKSFFGDDYLAFWTNGSYNIVLNSVLFSNPDDAMELYDEQLTWLESRLIYAKNHSANHIFVFGHHPWFLYSEDEEPEDLTGGCPYPKEWGKSDQVFSDLYFPVPKYQRQVAMRLFHKYGVSACFSGHFHQNLVSKSKFGMQMIVTAPLSIVFESTGKPKEQNELEENGRGIRIVTVFHNHFTHRFDLLKSKIFEKSQLPSIGTYRGFHCNAMNSRQYSNYGENTIMK